MNKGDEEGPNAQIPSLIWEQYRNPKRYAPDSNCEGVLLNHLNSNNCLVSKKGLYFSLKKYCEKLGRDLLEVVPRTFYISFAPGATNDESAEFLEYNKRAKAMLNSGDSENANKSSTSDIVNASKVFSDKDSNNSDCASSEAKSNSANIETTGGENLASSVEGGDVAETKDSGSSPSPPPYTSESVPSSKSQLSIDLSPLKNKQAARKEEEGIVWILKPAALANRGYGIQVVRGVDQVMEVVNKAISSRPVSADEGPGASSGKEATNKYGDSEEESKDAKDAKKLESLTKVARRAGMKQGWIVQEYMERPLLVAGRKFDVRCFALLTHDLKKGLKAYFFKNAYVRTSSKKYSMNKLDDRETHLTNDAVQKYSKSYGKFENGNKLNFVEWQESINIDYPGTPTDIVEKKIFPAIRAQTTFSICAAADELNSKNDSIKNSFELLGYDYMFTEDFQPRLIEINSNPCLEFACPLLKELITNLINGVVRTAIDPVLKPPPPGSRTKACEEALASIAEDEDRFECIFPPTSQ